MLIVYKGKKDRQIITHNDKRYVAERFIATEIPDEKCNGVPGNLGYGVLNTIHVLGGKDKKHPRKMDQVMQEAKRIAGEGAIIEFVNGQYQTYIKSKNFVVADDVDIYETKRILALKEKEEEEKKTKEKEEAKKQKELEELKLKEELALKIKLEEEIKEEKKTNSKTKIKEK